MIGFMSIFTYIKHHAVVSTTLAIVVVVIMIVAGRMATRNAIPERSNSSIKKVILANIKDFRSDSSIIAADGVVESISQADLKSQISAPVLAIHSSIGDFVNRGQVIVELQNADIRAQLDQARASLSLALGQFDTGTVSVDSAKKSAIDKIRDSYQKADDAVNIQIAQFLFNRNSDTSQLASLITDSKLYNSISIQWTTAGSIFADWKSKIDSLSDNSTDVEVDVVLVLSQKNLAIVSTLLDSVSMGLADATKSATAESLITIGTWKQVVGAVRNSISATTVSITSAETVLANTRVSHTSPGQAQISGAQAGVKNLEAQLAKTIITAPISGKIASMPLRVGELASPGQLIATIVGAGGLQVKAYVSGEDLSRIEKGAEVTVRGNIKGTILSISPSVNQVNKKAEIKISITGNTPGLIVGESVQALIKTKKSSLEISEGVYLLPMQNVKIVPGDAYVFIVSADSKIEKIPVTLGEVRGDFIEIKSGLNDDLQIVSPVYEIEEGELVQVQS